MRILTHSEQTWAPTPKDWLWGSLNSHNTTCNYGNAQQEESNVCYN
jgi:hypothetical protein